MSNTTDIAVSSPIGVFPFNTDTGSALPLPIWSRWEIHPMTKRVINRIGDKRESGRLDAADLRYAWDLSCSDLAYDHAALIWEFYQSHFGPVIPFYWYDIQQNGWVWDNTHTETNGRFIVRFGNQDLGRMMRRGDLFSMNFSVIEVE